MDRKAVVAGLLPALMLYSCDRAVEPPEPGSVIAASPGAGPDAGAGGATPAATDVASSDGGTAAGENDGSPDLTPPVLTDEAEKGVKGARNVLLSFARAIELREFDQAWAMLSPADRQKWSKPAFARLFADLGKITVAAPAGTMEGAAGSSYYTAPVTITANDKDGRPVRIDGEAVLRRVNDVDGATPAQLRWHFDKLTLDWTH